MTWAGVGNSSAYLGSAPFVLRTKVSDGTGPTGEHGGTAEIEEEKENAPFPAHGLGEHPRAFLWDRLDFYSARAAHEQRESALVRRRECGYRQCEVALCVPFARHVSNRNPSRRVDKVDGVPTTYVGDRPKIEQNHTCRRRKLRRCRSARGCRFVRIQRSREPIQRAYSKTRSPRPQMAVALTGTARGACNATSIRVFADGPCCVAGGTRRRYCGFTMYVGRV